jgi:hypothetical protein
MQSSHESPGDSRCLFWLHLPPITFVYDRCVRLWPPSVIRLLLPSILYSNTLQTRPKFSSLSFNIVVTHPVQILKASTFCQYSRVLSCDSQNVPNGTFPLTSNNPATKDDNYSAFLICTIKLAICRLDMVLLCCSNSVRTIGHS